MFTVNLRISLKRMLHQKEFLLAFSFVILLIFGTLFGNFFDFLGNSKLYWYPAWYYCGMAGDAFIRYPGLHGIMDGVPVATMLLFMIFLPFVASLAFSYAYFDDEKSGVTKQLLPRIGRGAYYRSTACVVFLGGFLVLFLPLLLEQLVLCIAFPWQLPTNVSSDAFLDDYVTCVQISDSLAALQMNHPYLYNLVAGMIPSITAGVLAYCSYTLSLFFHRSRFLVLTPPGMVWLLPQFALSSNGMSFGFYQAVLQLGPKTDLILWGLIFGGLLLANIILTEVKIRRSTDELSA